MRAFEPSQERGQLALGGSGGGPDDYIALKLGHWRGNRELLSRYVEGGARRVAELDTGAWRIKSEPTDSRLLANWHLALVGGDHPLFETCRRNRYSARQAERAIEAIPELLEGTVMLVDNIAARLAAWASIDLNLRDRHGLRVHLAKGFFSSYLDDLGATALIDNRVGVQEALFPAGASQISDRRLHSLLNALGVKEALLEQCSHESFARLVESETWRCLRPELMRRSLEEQPFNRRELAALQQARKVRRRARKDEREMLVESLARQHEALERTQLKPWGRSRLLGIRLGLEEAVMADAPSPSLVRGGFVKGTAVNPKFVSVMLEQVLEASTVGEARELIESLDSTLNQYTGLRAAAATELVAKLLSEQEELSDQARRLSPGLRTALINFATGTSSSVVGQGLMLGLKALGL